MKGVICMRSLRLFLSWVLLVVGTKPVYAILDGRSAPVFVDAAYTFSNYEWARGEVYFRRGFSVPESTTAILGLTVPVTSAIQVSDGSPFPSSPGRLILETPLMLEGASMTGKAIVRTSDLTPGFITGPSPAFGAPSLVTLNEMTIDFKGRSVSPSFFISNATPTKIRLVNGISTIILPTFDGGVLGSGRHEVVLENMSIFSSQYTTITFTNFNLTFTRGSSSFNSGGLPLAVDFWGTLKIDDDALVKANPGTTFNIKATALVGEDDYFQIAPRGTLMLDSNVVTYDRPLQFPYPVLPHDTYSRLLVDGVSTLRSTGSGSDKQVVFGVAPQLTGTSYASIDLVTGARLVLDDVALINHNFIQ